VGKGKEIDEICARKIIEGDLMRLSPINKRKLSRLVATVSLTIFE
jgi:hypothetical protein